MRQRVAKEGHAAQNDIRANHRADNADQDRSDHAALHEFDRIRAASKKLVSCGPSFPVITAVIHRQDVLAVRRA